MSKWSSVLLPGVVGAVCLAVLIVFYRYDPGDGGFYPPCIFHELTGLLCPGCGSLRSLHHLLHGNAIKAITLNLLFVLSVLFGTYVTARWVLLRVGYARLPLPRPVPNLDWIVPGAILAFGILRNLP